MGVTRDVILDLLPLYMADEVSADTRALVEEYLESDPSLQEVVERFRTMNMSVETPTPLAQEGKMQALKEAKQQMFLRTLMVAAVIAMALLSLSGVLAMFFLAR
jgi:hypothetical protein